jgi:uncharacterized RDD family membrane protein YckC
MEIWIGRDGERLGPFPDSEVRARLRRGEFTGEDLGWHDGLPDWQPLATLFPDECGAPATPPPLSTHAPATAQPPRAARPSLVPASFGRRLAAWVLDYLVLMVPSSMILARTTLSAATAQVFEAVSNGMPLAPALEAYEAAAQAARPAVLLVIVVGFLYYTLMEASPLQATLGKLAIGIRVTDLDGQRPGLGRCAARNAVRLLNIVTSLVPFIAYLAVAWTERRQGLHDLVAKALVLEGRVAAVESPTPAGRDDNNDRFSA